MAVPKRKTTPMKMGNRRSSHRKERVTIVLDQDSGEYRRPHHIDLRSGKYRSRQVVAVASKPADDGEE